MSMTLDKPDSVVDAIRLPKPRVHQELMLELAVALYSAQILPFGKARELASVAKYHFFQALGAKHIDRHYDDQDLADDVAYGIVTSGSDKMRVKVSE